MAATLISDSVVNYGNRTDTTITAPAGIVSGDELRIVLAVGQSGGAPAITPPSGFVSVGAPYPLTVDGGGFLLDVHILQKTAGGSEPASYTITHANGNSTAWMGTIRGGVNGASVVTGATDTVDPADPVAPDITPTTAGAFVLFFATSFNFLGAVTPPATPPAWDERLDSGSSILYVAVGNVAAPGAIGAKTVTVTQNPSTAGLMVIETAAAGGTGGIGSRFDDWF